jgi:hypothetical protein
MRRLLILLEVVALCVGVGIGRWLAVGGPWGDAIVFIFGAIAPVAITYWIAYRRGRENAREDERLRLLAATKAQLAATEKAAAGVERAIANNDEMLSRLYALRDRLPQ